jgi:hypothetical protein
MLGRLWMLLVLEIYFATNIYIFMGIIVLHISNLIFFTFLIIKSNKTFILLELGVQECDYFFDYRAGNRYYVF